MEIGNNEITKLIDNLKLIFYLDYNHFSYSIFNIHNNCFEKIKNYTIDVDKNRFSEEIQNIIKTDSDLCQKYKTIIGSIDIKPCTFIPEILFDKTNINDYLNFTSKINKNETCIYNKQQFADCYSIFPINNTLLSILQCNFNKLKIKNTGSVFVDYALNLSDKNNTEIFTQINEKDFHIALIKQSQFIFYNKFTFNNVADFVYHFMNCIRILDIDILKVKINFMSNLEKKNMLFDKIKKYVKTISFITRPREFLYQNDIVEDSEHKHHNLFSQLICE